MGCQEGSLIHHSRPRVARFGAGLAALVVLAAIAGSTAAVAAAGHSSTLDVRAGASACDVSGSPKSGWVQVDFSNDGAQNQVMGLVLLKKGVTAEQVLAAVTSNDDAEFGKIAASQDAISGLPELIGPDQKTSTVTRLKRGHYGVFCVVPTASDEQTDITASMVHVLDVSGAKSSRRPPTGRVTSITLTDTAIGVPAGGLGRLVRAKVTNKGTTPHTFTLVKVSDGSTLDDVKAYFDALFSTGPPAGDPPGVIVGGISDISPGATAYLVQTLAPGRYGYVSTDGDAPNDDYTKGMHGEFDVS
jgi:hypothetical protein